MLAVRLMAVAGPPLQTAGGVVVVTDGTGLTVRVADDDVTDGVQVPLTTQRYL